MQWLLVPTEQSAMKENRDKEDVRESPLLLHMVRGMHNKKIKNKKKPVVELGEGKPQFPDSVK